MNGVIVTGAAVVDELPTVHDGVLSGLTDDVEFAVISCGLRLVGTIV